MFAIFALGFIAGGAIAMALIFFGFCIGRREAA